MTQGGECVTIKTSVTPGCSQVIPGAQAETFMQGMIPSANERMGPQIMVWEKSCGAVVFTRMDGKIRYLLVANPEGTYGFPKGHVEKGETETETALREVFEETNLHVALLAGFRAKDAYPLPTGTMKRIVYFLGEFAGQEVIYQKEELSGFCFADYAGAKALLPYAGQKRILKKAETFLQAMEAVSDSAAKT